MVRAVKRRSEHLAEALRPARGQNDADHPADRIGARLVVSPVFVVSASARATEALAERLGAHPEIVAPKGLRLETLSVEPNRDYSEAIMGALGLDREELDHLLWDRVLHHELVRSGRSVIVDTSPANALIWRRILRAWPSARFVFVTDDATGDPAVQAALHEAMGELNGVEVSHKALTADPGEEIRRVLAHLGLA
ncbi:hypothetical protein GCM10010468_14230 [Actinocorallia longicatena]|uniref:AAA domain-containing protein n=1 Tax=Actinocorallia longicatena TaxID=111803 RepID=A0ABP6Q5L4_9ACTN